MLFALFLLLAAGCATPPRPAAMTRPPDGEAFLLTHVRLVPMDSQRVIEDGAVWVRDGVIAWAGEASAAPEVGEAAVVEGGGAWVVPGLVDAHVHLRDPNELDLYLLNGVTTVLNLSGVPEHLGLRRALAAAERRGPTLYTAGPTIDGDPPRNPRFTPAGDAERAAAIVAEQAEAGYDFVKIYDLIETEAYEAAVAAARSRDLPVVGHIPKKIGLEGILEGHHLIAHAEEYFYTFFANEADRGRLAEAARLTAEAGLAVCPNTGFIRSIIDQAEDLDAVLARPEVRYLPPAALVRWLPESNRYLGRPPEWLERNRVMHPFLLELTRALHEAGVPLLAGTDASVPGAVPGFSLHAELRELALAGLTPYEALGAATAAPGQWIAEHLDESAPPGVLAAGRRADLLLLDRDPLADLAALAEPRVVISRGRWIERAELVAAVEERARGYERTLLPYRQLVELVVAGRFADAETLYAESLETGGILDESRLNVLGYHYLRLGDPATAVEILAIVTRRHPESWNAWDSLGEAQLAAGDREAAIRSYRRSLELNPENRAGAQVLERLEGGVP